MNERHDSYNGKITPLFQSPVPPDSLDEENLLRWLDEPDESEAKRTFLNQCAFSEEALESWQTLTRALDAGRKLPVHDPDPAIRSHVLDAAFAAVRGLDTESVQFTSRRSGLPGWRWAWAALFLAFLWSGYQEYQQSNLTSTLSTTTSDALDYELLTLEAELEQLQSELGIDLNLDRDGRA